MPDWSLEAIHEYCEQQFHGSIALEVSMVDGKGRVMIAKQDFRQGDIVVEEPPLHFAVEDKDNPAFQVVKQLCEQESDIFHFEPLWYWAAASSLTEEQLTTKPNVGSLPTITRDQQRLMMCLYHEPVTEVSRAIERLIEVLGLADVSPVLLQELLDAWILNCFEHTDDPLGYSAYFASSFMSHSCFPNAIWTEADDGVHVVRARQDISCGTEVMISYIDESVLLQPAEKRKVALFDSKQFECACARCAVPEGVEGPAGFGLDRCRGFRCKACNECGVFFRLDESLASEASISERKGGSGIEGAECALCGAVVDRIDAEGLLRSESLLEQQVKVMDEQLAKGSLQINEAKSRQLLQAMEPSSKVRVGPQHWVCDQVWEHLENMYDHQSRRHEQRQMIKHRVEYQQKAYPGLSGALAWTLEQYGDTLLKHLGCGTAEMLEEDPEHEAEIESEVLPILEQSLHMLELMFGKGHEHHASVENKYRVALDFLEKRGNLEVDFQEKRSNLYDAQEHIDSAPKKPRKLYFL